MIFCPDNEIRGFFLFSLHKTASAFSVQCYFLFAITSIRIDIFRMQFLEYNYLAQRHFCLPLRCIVKSTVFVLFVLGFPIVHVLHPGSYLPGSCISCCIHLLCILDSDVVHAIV